jgi:hypothetical protein
MRWIATLLIFLAGCAATKFDSTVDVKAKYNPQIPDKIDIEVSVSLRKKW